MNGNADNVFDGAGQVEDTQPQAGPANLQDAFIALRESEQEEAEEPVQSGEGVDGEETPDESGEAAGGEPGVGFGEESDESDGGLAAGSDEFDSPDYTDRLNQELNKAATQSVVAQFRQAGIRTFNVNDLYQRDERTGSVSFVNPDNPQRPFASRAEAQAWCESVNKDIEAELRKSIRAERGRLAKAYKPAIELLRWAPEFNKMSPEKRELVAELIDPYSVVDSQGNVIGYNCDLNKMSAQADKILSRFSTRRQTPAADKPKTKGEEPALDTPSSSGSGDGATKEEEPETLEDAFRILNKKGRK